jgi:uncharacterized protein (TIGR03382 family)
VLGAGLPGVTAVDGTGATVTALPDQEYAAALGTTARDPRSVLDLGAYGFPRGSDGGTPDAGSPDGGVPDAGASPDAGGDPPGNGPTGPGEIVGSCSSAPAAIPVLALAALVALLGRRRSVNSRS